MTVAARIFAAAIVAAFTHHAAVAQPAVPGAYRLLHADEPDRVGAGLVLISELKCASCHALPEPVRASAVWDAREVRPIQNTTASGRIAAFMASPLDVKPGTAMPDVHLTDDESRAIYAFLASRSDNKPAPAVAKTPDGADLYHSLGCVACHTPKRDPVLVGDPDDPFGGSVAVTYEQPEVPSIPMLLAGDEDWVMRDPHSSRMAHMRLSEDEVQALTSYIRSEDAGSGFVANPAASVSEGAAAFQRKGCAQCHSGTGVEPVDRDSFGALANLDAGCLAEHVEAPAADYALNDEQRGAIRAALQLKSPRTGPSWKVLGTAAARNCLACHDRDGFGGPEPGRVPYFTTTVEADLGDEGRIPPTLTGVGAKLTPEALRAVLTGQGDARPYMATRMPLYSFSDVDALVDAFLEADEGQFPAKANVTGLEHHHRNHYGRELAGEDAMGCVSCHAINGHPSLGIPALDLALSPNRLQPDWFLAYMLDPAALRPGTRMPAYFPEGKSTYPGLFGGNAQKQIEALWVYLREIDQTRLPEGMEDTDRYVLTPDDRPIIHRTFMKDAGTRAIAVGFPEGVHIAFDATNVRASLAWRGGYLDANATWNDRFSPLIAPLGGDIWHFPDAPPIALDGSADADWPRDANGYRFRGFVLDGGGVPAFQYSVGDASIEERLTPLVNGDGLVRRIRIGGSSKPIRFLAAMGKKIAGENDGYRVDDDWQTTVQAEGGEAHVIERAPDRADLILVIPPGDNERLIVQEIVW